MDVIRICPVLRIFDVGLTEAFYLGFLGFAEDWRHAPAGAPVYMQVSRYRGILRTYFRRAGLTRKWVPFRSDGSREPRGTGSLCILRRTAAARAARSRP
jgi:hypothetical protein